MRYWLGSSQKTRCPLGGRGGRWGIYTTHSSGCFGANRRWTMKRKQFAESHRDEPVDFFFSFLHKRTLYGWVPNETASSMTNVANQQHPDKRLRITLTTVPLNIYLTQWCLAQLSVLIGEEINEGVVTVETRRVPLFGNCCLASFQSSWLLCFA